MFSIRFSMISASAALVAMLVAPQSQAAEAAAISAANGYTCALTTTGGVQCWGSNNYGQLGNGTIVNSLVPTGVSGLSSGVTQIATNFGHTCARLTSGTVRCWGRNNNGQLGTGNVTDSRVPVVVSGLSGVVAVAVGGHHSCALMATGTVKCWGENAAGQLGDGTTTQRATPTAVFSVSGALAIAAGSFHTCALINNGQVKCWGSNNNGQLGNGSIVNSSTRVDVLGLTNAVSITAGFRYTCAKTSTGAAKCWGENNVGQIGNGSTVNVLTPTNVSGLSSGVTQLTAYNYGGSTCAVLAGGTAKCWGRNTSGQLSSGDTVNKLTPTTVVGLAGAISSISVGSNHGCARVSAGVQCWGSNSLGQHGAGNTNSTIFPQYTVGFRKPVVTRINVDSISTTPGYEGYLNYGQGLKWRVKDGLTVTGTALDAAGALIPNATIDLEVRTVTNSIVVKSTATTDISGKFTMQMGLQPAVGQFVFNNRTSLHYYDIIPATFKSGGTTIAANIADLYHFAYQVFTPF